MLHRMICGVVLLSLFGVCHAEGDNVWQWTRWTEDYKDSRMEYREIVFPLHPYHEFYGLLTSTTHKR